MGYLVNLRLRVRPVRGCDVCGCGMGVLGWGSLLLPEESEHTHVLCTTLVEVRCVWLRYI